MNKKISICFKISFFNIITILFLIMFQMSLVFISPKIISYIIDLIIVNKISKSIYTFVLVYFLLSVILVTVRLTLKYYFKNMSLNMTNKLRALVKDYILSYDDKFFRDKSVGNLLEYFERNINVIDNFISKVLPSFIIYFLTVISVIVSFYLESISMGVIFSIYIFSFIILLLFTILSQKEILLKNKEITTFNIGKYSEWINNSSELKMMNGYSYIEDKMDNMDVEFLDIEIKTQKYLYKIWSLTLFFSVFTIVLTLFFGGSLYFNGIISFGTIYTLYSYSNLLKEPIENLQAHLQSYLNVRACFKRIYEIFNYKPEVSFGNSDINQQLNNITIKNLYYSYNNNNEEYCLKNINVTLEINNIVGIVGKSGSGKTTFCKVLSKAIQKTKGDIYINDVDIEKLSRICINKTITYISSTSNIFDTTIRNNFTFFDSNICDKYIISKLKYYNLLDYFKQYGDNFLDKVINNDILSIGQKQIICLVRTILNTNASLIIFDETYSKIDKDITNIFFDILLKMLKDKIIIIVSHNDETINYCNKVIIFEDGKIVETGEKNDILKNAKSKYYKIMELSEES